MGKKDEAKPRGRMSSYAFFVQTCREEHKKKHPGESVVFAEFTKKCAEKWKEMTPKEKRRFEEMAERDKARYDREMANYVPPKGKAAKRKRTKDPNAPKRALSAFFFYCADARPKLRVEQPGLSVAEVAKELGKRWETLTDRPKFEAQAAKDKERYEKDMVSYRNGTYTAVGAASNKKSKPEPPPPKAAAKDDDDDDEDEEEEEEEEEDDDDDDDE